jgi:hypothetical protein
MIWQAQRPECFLWAVGRWTVRGHFSTRLARVSVSRLWLAAAAFGVVLPQSIVGSRLISHCINGGYPKIWCGARTVGAKRLLLNIVN